MKPHRAFLEPVDGADSYVAVYIPTGSTDIALKLADCYRTVTITFGTKARDKRFYLGKLKRLQVALDLIEKTLKKK